MKKHLSIEKYIRAGRFKRDRLLKAFLIAFMVVPVCVYATSSGVSGYFWGAVSIFCVFVGTVSMIGHVALENARKDLYEKKMQEEREQRYDFRYKN